MIDIRTTSALRDGACMECSPREGRSEEIAEFLIGSLRLRLCQARPMTTPARMRTCDAAVLVLRETGDPAVMWGDAHLLRLIAERAGIPVRDGRERFLIPKHTICGGRERLVRIFRLPDGENMRESES